MRKLRGEWLPRFGSPLGGLLSPPLTPQLYACGLHIVDPATLFTLDGCPASTWSILKTAILRMREGRSLEGELRATLRFRFRAVLEGQPWEAAFPLPWTRPVRPLPTDTPTRVAPASSRAAAPACPGADDQTRFRYPDLLLSPSGRLDLAPPAGCVARALAYFCALPVGAPDLPAWLHDGLLARLEWVLASGADWEVAFPLPGRARVPDSGFIAASPRILLGLECWVLCRGTRHSPALPRFEALIRLAEYRQISPHTIATAFTCVNKLARAHEEPGPRNQRVPGWPFQSTLYPIARLTAVAICRDAPPGRSHGSRSQLMRNGAPRRVWRDHGSPPYPLQPTGGLDHVRPPIDPCRPAPRAQSYPR